MLNFIIVLIRKNISSVLNCPLMRLNWHRPYQNNKHYQSGMCTEPVKFNIQAKIEDLAVYIRDLHVNWFEKKNK